MKFNQFLHELYNLINSHNGLKITFEVQKNNIIDILVSIYEDVILETSINTSSDKEEDKMKKIIYAINEYC